MTVLANAIDWRMAAAAKKADQDGRLASLPSSLFVAADSVPNSEHAVKLTDQKAIEMDLEYLSASAREITSNIEKKKKGWTATRVMEAYIRSAVRAHQATNCLTEMLFTDALERARALDKDFAKAGKLKGPLHGVPVSIKDQIDVQGEDSSIGFTSWANDPASENAELVNLLIEAGGIPFTKTNVPQTMLAFECSNPLFGATLNPYNPLFTSGGSSGGEAALLGSDGSALGIGSDIGGSLRIPAHYSGCYGLKPSMLRFTSTGAQAPAKGFESIKSSLGPMGRCADDLEHASKVILSASEKIWRKYDLVPLPWREEEADKITKKKSLKIGYFTNDEICKASPACQRAVNETIGALRKQGHQCVPIDVSKLEVVKAVELFVGLTSADGYEALQSHIKGDPRESSLFLTTLGPRVPWPLRSIATFFMRRVAGDVTMATIVGSSRKKTVGELMEFQGRRSELCMRVRKYLWEEMDLDALICPTQSMPSVPCGSTWNRSFISMATFYFNVVDSTVGVVPVTTVDPEKDQLSPEWESQPFHSPLIHRALYAPNGVGIYDPSFPTPDRPKGMGGLPVGVQVVGGQWEEEKVVRLMKVVEGALGEKRTFGPGRFAEGKLKQEGVNGKK